MRKGKRIVSVICSFMLCIALGSPIFAPAEAADPIPNETDTQIAEKEDYLIGYASPELMESLFGVPESILAEDTADLFAYFLQSKFFGQEMFSCSSTFEADREYIDFTCHDAFAELITREDFIPTLEAYAANLLADDLSGNYNYRALEKILRQEAVQKLCQDSPQFAQEYPFIYAVSEGFVSTASRDGGLVGYINDIPYYARAK